MNVCLYKAHEQQRKIYIVNMYIGIIWNSHARTKSADTPGLTKESVCSGQVAQTATAM